MNYSLKIIAGIDEAGRGCLAGPVVAACLAIDFFNLKNKRSSETVFKMLREVRDSKQLSKIKRERLFDIVNNLQSLDMLYFGIGIISPKIIDEINILAATKLAMHQAYLNLVKNHQISVDEILVDGNFIPFAKQDKISEIKSIIRGDAIEPIISAASIIAKVWRDRSMQDLAKEFSQYGFERHAGYGTKFHLEQIKKFGPSKIHRMSFEPIKSMIKT